MSDTKFKAKVVIKKKSLPTKPINIRIQASPEGQSEGGAFGSSSPTAADEAAFKFPSSPRPKISGAKKYSGRKGSYK